MQHAQHAIYMRLAAAIGWKPAWIVRSGPVPGQLFRERDFDGKGVADLNSAYPYRMNSTSAIPDKTAVLLRIYKHIRRQYTTTVLYLLCTC